MQKVELTKQEALLVMRMLNYFLIAQSNIATQQSDVAGAKDLKNNLFRQIMAIDESKEQVSKSTKQD
ncbi:hypothetical protein [uncultured Parasutterella sp.]|uniref:hypothetical protein n=1 Tax=uncultured Parasutterella sp. TaxID=1263098 RepID=UPI0034A4E22C